MWSKYDKDGNETLEYEELKKFTIDTLKKIRGENAVVPSEDEMHNTFKKYDKDGNGHVSKAEMTEFIKAQLNQNRK